MNYRFIPDQWWLPYWTREAKERGYERKQADVFTRLTHVREGTLQNRESRNRALLQVSYGLEVPCTKMHSQLC